MLSDRSSLRRAIFAVLLAAAAPLCLAASDPPASGPAAIEPPLLAAARRGDVAEIERLFLLGEDLNQAGANRQTALHVAAEAAQDKTAAWLLAHEANVFAKDARGQTAADVATVAGHRACSTVLKKFMLLSSIEQSASADGAWDDLADALTRDSRGYTLLHILAIRGNTDEMSRRIQAGAAVDARTTLGITPLMKAAALGHKDAVALLLKSGASANAKDVLSTTPLMAAVFSGSEEIVKMLLDAGADPKVKSKRGGDDALAVAEKMRRTAIADLLRRSGG